MSTAKAIGASNLQLPDPAENYSLPTLNTNFSTIADEVNKNVDGLGTPIASKIASGNGSISISSGVSFNVNSVALPAGFTQAPNVVVTLGSNVAGRASLLQIYAYTITTTSFNVKIQTSDNAAIGTSYTINYQWVAIQ
jgi:hypothetical protein